MTQDSRFLRIQNGDFTILLDMEYNQQSLTQHGKQLDNLISFSTVIIFLSYFLGCANSPSITGKATYWFVPLYSVVVD